VFFFQNPSLFKPFCIALFIIAGVIVLDFVIRRVTRLTYRDIGEFGTTAQTMLGKIKEYTPLAPGNLAPGRTAIEEAKPIVPRLGKLIQDSSLTNQSIDGARILVGFREDQSPRYERMPGVTAITGMQNVGKSVTMLMLVLIALLQGANVVVCDTHFNKARSLYKKIAGLSDYLTFALTEEEVLQETRNFSQELLNRKRGSRPYPYVIFYDELNSLVRSKQLKEQIVTTMEEASQEGLGFNLHLVCAIHNLSNDGIGDATLRSFFNMIFCHKMLADQSKFIEAFNTRKIRSTIASLPQGQAMVKDEYNEIEKLTIPYGDSTDVLTAKSQLDRLQTPTIKELVSPTQVTEEIKEQATSTYAEMESLPAKRPELSGDLLTVYNAVNTLRAQGKNISSRNVGELVGIGHDKANGLLNRLAETGILTR